MTQIGANQRVLPSCLHRSFDAVFCSGYGLAQSHMGLSDEGFIAWPDMVSWCQRIRAILPSEHIVVDIDEGYGDPRLAAIVARQLETVGASACILEDQRRPKRCGHLPGKEIIPVDDYLIRLKSVLAGRTDLFVFAVRPPTPNLATTHSST